MTQIRNYAIERLASTIHDDDLIDIQIMEAGADQYEEARMKVSELRKLMNDGATPLRYKALISQNAPVASTVNVSMVAGQIWTLEIYSGLDFVDPFSGLELISGTIRVAGSKYRSNTDVSFTFTTTEMSYDGSPYVVSTDANGDLNPFVNTLGITPTFSYQGVGQYLISSATALFLESKTGLKIQPGYLNGIGDKTLIYRSNNNNIAIDSCSNQTTPSDDALYYHLIEIEVYP